MLVPISLGDMGGPEPRETGGMPLTELLLDVMLNMLRAVMEPFSMSVGAGGRPVRATESLGLESRGFELRVHPRR